MRVGVIARSEDRGLGIQTLEVCRHLNPDKVLLVTPAQPRWPTHPQRYQEWDPLCLPWDRDRLHWKKTTKWLADLDVVYTAETLYDWNMWSWFNGRIVCHVNPEMIRPQLLETPNVAWWSATSWRADQLPASNRIVPMPAPTDRFAGRTAGDGRLRLLHVVGHGAVFDRNGSQVVAEALPHITRDCTLEVTCQDSLLPRGLRGSTNERVEFIYDRKGVADYWQLYSQADVLVMPRRFGGLCLPVIEALAAGLVVVLTDCSPNETWPGPKIPVRSSTAARMTGVLVDVHDPDPVALAEIINSLDLEQWQTAGKRWVAENSWEALLPTWRRELEAVAP